MLEVTILVYSWEDGTWSFHIDAADDFEPLGAQHGFSSCKEARQAAEEVVAHCGWVSTDATVEEHAD